MTLRSPIVSVLGHVDHGKSSILDAIRESNIVATEAGHITQAIGASIIPTSAIIQRFGDLIKTMGFSLTLPGILFIDTPGHAAFTTLRKRGGSLADLAVLAVDINEGFKPQTKEAVEILRNAKTPFIIAANKIDLAPGFEAKKGTLLDVLNAQPSNVQSYLDTKLYEIVGTLYENFQLTAERFDRIEDFTKTLAIVPCSAKTKTGIPELIVLIAGLAQRFLEKNLHITTNAPAKGTILEVKEDKGLGTTIDVIIYDGTITVGDTLILGGLQEPIVTKVRSLLEPAPLAEMRDKKSPFTPIQQAVAATGVKIVAPGLENAMAGAPLRTCKAEDVEEVKRAIQEEIKTSIITTDKKGIVIKADTLGSLEALAHLLRERNIPIRKASVGPITKKDIADAESNAEKDPLTAVILGFNLPQPRTPSNVTVITDTIIYKLIERFEEWQAKAQDAIRAKELQNVTRPCKLEILPNCIFRQSNPAIVGVEVLAGTLTSGMTLTKAGTPLATVKSMQKEKENVNSAPRGTQLAISLPGIIAGKHVGEGDILYSYLSEEEFRKLKSLVKFLTSDEKGALKEIAHIMREHNPVWGV